MLTFINNYLKSDNNHRTSALDSNNTIGVFILRHHSNAELDDESSVEQFILAPHPYYEYKFLNSSDGRTSSLAYDILTENQNDFIDALNGELAESGANLTELEDYAIPSYIYKTQTETVMVTLTDENIIISVIRGIA